MKTFRTILLVVAAVVAFRLQAAPGAMVKYSGTVVDANGKPVADASVGYYRFAQLRQEAESKGQTTSRENGTFEFSAPDSEVIVVVKKTGFAYVWKTLQSGSTGDAGSLVLEAPSSLAGTVVDENGRPVANAEVSVWMAVEKFDAALNTQPSYIFGHAAKDLFSARTSSDGHFRIANFPSGAQANLTVKAPGKVLKISNVRTVGNQMQAQAGQENIKLVTEAAASIEGVVVARDGGPPLAGAGIMLQPANGGGFFSGSMESSFSGANGAFRIADLPAGSYRLTATFTNKPVADWVAEAVPVTVTAGQTLRDVKVEAIKGGVVEVTVTMKGSSEGEAGVTVYAYSQEQGQPANGITGSDGKVSLRVPPGQFTISANKRGASQAQVQTSVSDGETTRVKLALPLPLKIAGTLRDSSGSPVAGATVGVYPNYGGGNQDAKSGADGHYEVTWQKPSWAGMQDQRFYLVARDARHNLAAVKEIDESATSLDVEMKPGMSISATVQDAQGKPITNASAWVMLQMPNMGFTISRQQARVDEEGRLRVDALPRGEHYNVSFFAPGYGNNQGNMGAPDPKADHYDFAPVVLNLADRKVAGRVLGSNGKPAAGVQVWINGPGQPNGNATTDADGGFAFDAVCEGPITIQASGKGGNGSIQAKGGDTNVTIRFGANYYAGMNASSVSGTVYDASGAPVSNVSVMVTPSFGPYNNDTTDEKGAFTVNWQAQGGMRGVKYYVIARDPKRNQVGLEEINDKTTSATVRMQEGISISGTVQDEDGTPFPDARVNLNMMSGNMGGLITHEPIRIESDGTFTIPALPRGQQYLVNVSAMDHGSLSRNVSKTQSQNNNVELQTYKLRKADQDLAGQVVGPDGKPIGGARIYTYGNNQPNVNEETDADGRFKIKVCPGMVSVQAYSQTMMANGMNFANAQVRGGDMNVVLKLGVPQQRGRPTVTALKLKPRPWSLSAFVAWPAGHKTSAIILMGLQASLLLGAGAVVFLVTRKRDS